MCIYQYAKFVSYGIYLHTYINVTSHRVSQKLILKILTYTKTLIYNGLVIAK